MGLVAVFLAWLLAYAAVARPLERTPLTSPILFTAAGALALAVHPAWGRSGGDPGILLHVAELGLVLLLFSDARRVDLSSLRGGARLPTRLLTVGMLLTLAFGLAAARLVFPDLDLWEAGVLAAVLAPTDAGLGHVIVSDPRVPAPIRQALNIEAGLNDGLSVPFLLFFLALAEGPGTGSGLAGYLVEQLGYGALLGAGIGFLGGGLLGAARRRGWTTPTTEPLGVVALPLLCLVCSPLVGASMFIAAFVAGFAARTGLPAAEGHGVDFAEEWGQLVNLSVFFTFGTILVRHADRFAPVHFLYGVLSLTVVRMVPVAVALIGARLRASTVLFLGWFGPRGLASIVLCLVYLERREATAGPSTVTLAVLATVLLSVLAHGVSARPGTAAYARRAEP